MQCFNSTMVRLKDPDAFTKFDLATFQFHYGTIKSNRVEAVTDVELTFNSTMVRLKDLDIAQMSNDYNNFNSTMVRLFQNIKSFIFHFIIFSEEVYYIRIEILKISILKLFLFVFSQ